MVFSRSGNVPDRPADARAKNSSPESDLARYTSLYTNNTPVLDSILYSIYSLTVHWRHGRSLVNSLRIFLFML